MALSPHKTVNWGIRALGFVVIWFSLIGIAGAQETPISVSGLSKAELEVVLGRLSDEQVRDILIAEFAEQRAESDAAAPSTGLLSNAREAIETLTTNASALIAKWPQFGDAFRTVGARLEGAGGIGFAIVALLMCLAAGSAVRYFWRRRSLQRKLEIAERNVDKGSYGSVTTIGDAALFLLIELSSVLAFAMTAMAALYLFFQNDDLRFFVSSYVAMVTVVLVVCSFVEFMFPRDWPIYRLVAIDNRATRLVHLVIVGLSALWMFETTTSDVMSQFGAPAGTPDLLSIGLGVVWISGALIGIFLINRATRNALPHSEETGFANALARNWARIAALLQVCTWALFTGGALILGNVDTVAKNIFLNMLVFTGFWMSYRILIHYLRAQQMNEAIEAAIGRTARTLLSAAGFMIILAIWGVDPGTLAAGGIAERAIQATINVALTALIGWAVWDFIRTIIDVRTAAEQPQGDEAAAAGDEGGAGGSRTATLLPILRSFAFAVIGLTCLFTALSSLGVNVAPLVAGAGVVGLAIGFGAQTLVKDIVSGAFFLIDDAFRVGEYIVIEDTVGTVEKISLRSLQLRHHNGPVHTIPFGEIAKLTNNSRDWVIMKLKFTVPFGTDVNKIKKLFKQIGAEMLETEYADDLIQTFKSQGVYDVDDVGMVIRGKFMTKPGKQWVIRKDVYSRVQKKLEENGIDFARREVRVQIPGVTESRDLTDEQINSIGAAAAQAQPLPEVTAKA
ncbi:MAG: mechanosensitive ion channel domain-containing protein [Pseudomonadota bacterium]